MKCVDEDDRLSRNFAFQDCLAMAAFSGSLGSPRKSVSLGPRLEAQLTCTELQFTAYPQSAIAGPISPGLEAGICMAAGDDRCRDCIHPVRRLICHSLLFHMAR